MWVRLHVAETALRAASKAPAEVTDGWAKGVQACIDWVEKRRHDFESEYGMADPSTGAMEFRNTAREEYDIELCEIEEGLRAMLALRPTSTTRAGEGK